MGAEALLRLGPGAERGSRANGAVAAGTVKFQVRRCILLL